MTATLPARDDLRSRGTPLEYWFFRVSGGGVGLLVDIIARRRTGSWEVRVSAFVGGGGRVVRSRVSDGRAIDGGAEAAGCTVRAEGSSGSVADVRWSLSFDPGEARIDPSKLPTRLLRPIGMDLRSRPEVAMTGTIEVAGQTFAVAGVPGLLCHYWGSRLPGNWRWLSATGLAPDGGAVEALVFRARPWGLPPAIPAGYVWLRWPDGRAELLVSPFDGIVRWAGTPERSTIRGLRLGGRTISVHCEAPTGAYVDLGEGIRQTLLGTCRIDGLGVAAGTAGLEYRLGD